MISLVYLGEWWGARKKIKIDTFNFPIFQGYSKVGKDKESFRFYEKKIVVAFIRETNLQIRGARFDFYSTPKSNFEDSQENIYIIITTKKKTRS